MGTKAGTRRKLAFPDVAKFASRPTREARMRWVVRIFAVVGALATLLVLLALLAVANSRFGRFSNDYIFNMGGLDPRQAYTVVWDRSEAPSRGRRP